MHKELPNWNPVGFLWYVCDVELHCLSYIGAEYRLEVQHYTIQEGCPGFPCILFVHFSTQAISENSVGLSLHNFLPGLASFICENVSIDMPNLCAEHSAHSCALFLAILALLSAALAATTVV